MKTFKQYVNFRELAAYDVGTDVMGKTSMDADSKSAFTAALQAFEVVVSRNSTAAAQFLNRMSEQMPELKAILAKHGLDTFKDAGFKSGMRKAAMKGVRAGLGDVSADTDGSDVVVPNSADSHQNPIG